MRKAAILNWIAYRAAVRSRQRPASPQWKVGIYKVDRLGDFVLSLGAIRAIVREAGAANCVIFHSAVSSQIAEREFRGVTRIEMPDLDGKLWITRRRLRNFLATSAASGGVDQLICLRHFRSLSDEIALQAIPARKVWCVRNSEVVKVAYELVRRRFEGDGIVGRPQKVAAGTCEDLACHEAVVSAWAGTAHSREDMLPWLTPSGSRPATVMSVTPFGSERIRDLSVGCVAAAAAHARRAHGLDCELLAPSSAVRRYEAFAAQMRALGRPVSVRVTETTAEFMDALGSSSVVLSTETATAHIAAALDKPLVCVLGGGHFGLFAPWQRSSRQAWVSHEMPCFRCNWECVHPEPFCITRVSADAVIAALDRVAAASRMQAAPISA